MPDWQTLLRAEGCEPGPGADARAIDAAEVSTGLRLPAELRLLYLSADGVFDTAGQWHVIWPLAMLAEENAHRRYAGLLPADLLAFGDDGAGNPFCTEPGRPEVTCWHPVDSWKQLLAPDLSTFWQGWTRGTITT